MSRLFPHNKRCTALKLLATVTCMTLVALGGCFNPAFVNQLSGGSVVPIAPGDTPFIHVLVINATLSHTLNFQFGWTPDFQGYNTSFVFGIAPRQQQGFLLGCPIDQIGLGNPGDLNAPAIIISPEGGGNINVPPGAFPLVLVRNRDFVCGDTVVFTVIDDQTSGYGIAVLPGRVDGSTQRGPFTGPDTFEIVNFMIMSAGIPPIPVQ
jgi:hypothetical protein